MRLFQRLFRASHAGNHRPRRRPPLRSLESLERRALMAADFSSVTVSDFDFDGDGIADAVAVTSETYDPHGNVTLRIDEFDSGRDGTGIFMKMVARS